MQHLPRLVQYSNKNGAHADTHHPCHPNLPPALDFNSTSPQSTTRCSLSLWLPPLDLIPSHSSCRYRDLPHIMT